MGKRRQSRELAFQLLYAAELSMEPREQVLSKSKTLYEQIDDEVWRYAEQIFSWVFDNIEGIDKRLAEIITNWSLQRVSKVDLSLIRMGCAEMKYGDIPASIVINEILELSKEFGDKESTSFVNGVLDSWYNNASDR
jgi:N utilization substance protein B